LSLIILLKKALLRQDLHTTKHITSSILTQHPAPFLHYPQTIAPCAYYSVILYSNAFFININQ